ncbi:MAG: SMC-Scp complex subunit ScpB [Planctomycetes bacterium]|nr:SMC-Scp complex subunit ScpB [Planctomycetota bacterium]
MADNLNDTYLNQTWEVDGAAAGATPAHEDTAAAPPEPRQIIEALLFVGGEPLTAERACDTVRGLAPAQYHQAIADLNRDYRRQGRPYAIVPRGDGHVLTLRPQFRDVVDKLYGGVREARLSTAVLDVLSLVAYRQPITRLEVDALRGADSAHLLRQLVRRGLIEASHRGDAAAKEVSYGTTQRFLELFDLKGLDDLPRTQDLQQI